MIMLLASNLRCCVVSLHRQHSSMSARPELTNRQKCHEATTLFPLGIRQNATCKPAATKSRRRLFRLPPIRTRPAMPSDRT